MGIKKRSAGKKSKSLASTKKKVTKSLSAKRKESQSEKGQVLKQKRRAEAGKASLRDLAPKPALVAPKTASRESVNWGNTGFSENAQDAYIGKDAEEAAVTLKALNEGLIFTLTHHRDVSYSRSGTNNVVRILYDDGNKVKSFKFK